MKRPYWIRPAIFGPYTAQRKRSTGDRAVGLFTIVAWVVIAILAIWGTVGCAPLPEDPAVRYWRCLSSPPYSYIRCDEEERQQRRQS